MQKVEAKFTLLFRHWLKVNPMQSAAFELKQCGSSIPFSAIRLHQVDGLRASKSDNGLLYKLPDDSAGMKPYDLFYLRHAKAYVVILFRAQRFFVLLDIDDFMLEWQTSKRKSLTADRAREISTVVVEIPAKR